MSRVLIASNRLPVTLRADHGEVRVTPSSGGLATALSPIHGEGDSLWFGYPGEIPKGLEARSAASLAELRAKPIAISSAEVARYYDGFSNAVLWPLFHYLLDVVERDASQTFSTYRTVNQRFCDAIVAEYQVGDTIWVHDYHLLLLPAMLRERLPSASIGLFLHVPFPSADVFRTVPNRDELVRGMLGADLVGFHTASYRHNFAHAADLLLGVELGIDSLRFEDRQIALGVHPIGIDVDGFERLANEPRTIEEARELRRATQGKAVLLGVDRLDYTKGLRRRLLAIDRMLEREPQLREKIHFIQVAVPSRERVDAYVDVRRDVNELTGRINAHHGSATGAPVQLLYRSITPQHLVALYRAADVMLVTPLRDGMNLVAKEYVASRVDEDGVLVLSEFAGAASELEEAIAVNPYDVGDLATQFRRAIGLPLVERRTRMRALRRRVHATDVRAWVAGFLGELERAADGRASVPQIVAAPVALEGLTGEIDRRPRGERRLVMLDYDGTLVPYASVPELASPDDELLDLLRRLGGHESYDVHIVTGRSRSSIESWLGGLPLTLHAEHGAFSQRPDASWTSAVEPPLAWLEPVTVALSAVARRTPGAIVERKEASVAFHHRRCDPTLAGERLREVREVLNLGLLGTDAEVLEGNKVLEVRVRGIDKGALARRLTAVGADLIVAAGDDRTDEDMFRVLPDDAISIRVGRGATHARYRLDGPTQLRAALERLAALP